ncbi:hypothetical protein COOONC_14600, partial [Cooperia oncophora]
MEKVVTYFQNVLSVNVSADTYDTPAWLRNVCQQIVSGIAWCKVNNQRVSFFLKPGLEGCDVSELVRTIGDELAQCEQLAIRAGKRVPTDNGLKLTPQAALLDELSRLPTPRSQSVTAQPYYTRTDEAEEKPV